MELVERFPDSHYALLTRDLFNLSGDRKIKVGATIPDFEIPNADAPSEIISMQKLRGK